jgi:hypothetical protein
MGRSLIAPINYVARTGERPRYYANDHSRDTVVIAPQPMHIIDGRAAPPSLEQQGFALVPHDCGTIDMSDADARERLKEATRQLVADTCGADAVIINAPGVLRFSERSGKAGTLNNSYPARFNHVDISDPTAAAFAARGAPEGRTIARAVHYNIWRVLTPPPQDVPLGLCDASSVHPDDLIPADAIFDEAGKPEWSFEGLVVAHNPAHRWFWFPDMTSDEAIIFVTNDSEEGRPHCVPHCAFDDPATAPDAPARGSVEMRAMALWFA